MSKQPSVVYSIPGMADSKVKKDITYKIIEDTKLQLDVYYPADYQLHTRLPAVIFIHGDGPAEYLEAIKDNTQYVPWGQLIAASGLIAVTANHRSTERLHNVAGVANDVDDLITYIQENGAELGIDTTKLAIWTCSAGAYFGLRVALHDTPSYIRAVACYYGYTELKAIYRRNYEDLDEDTPITVPMFSEDDFAEFSSIEFLHRRYGEVAPLFIARAGLDNPLLNESLDQFVQEALRQNLLITVMNHPNGQHGFDVVDNDARSHEIIRTTLEFFQTHLLQ